MMDSLVETTGTSGRGNAMHGKIVLVEEGADCKVEDAFWAT